MPAGHEHLVRLRKCEETETALRRFRQRELANRITLPTLTIARDLASRLLSLIAGYTCMVTVRLPESLVGCLIFAIADVALLGSWFHDIVHMTKKSRTCGLRTLVRMISAPVGFGPLWWSYKHVRMHHRYVANPEFDPDIQFGYIARVSPAQTWHPIHAAQPIYLWLLLPFSTLNMLKPAELARARNFRKYRGIGRPPCAGRKPGQGRDLGFHAACWYSLVSPESMVLRWIRSAGVGNGITLGSSFGARSARPAPWWLRPVL